MAEEGRTNQARTLFQQATALEREQLRLNPTATDFGMNLVESDFCLAGLERETGHFDLAESACAEALDITNKALQDAAPINGWHWARMNIAIESVRLSVRTGESLSGRASTLRVLVQALEEATPGGPFVQADRHLAAEAYLALAEVAARCDNAPAILEALKSADSSLDVVFRATPERPRLRGLKAKIAMMRGSALAGAGNAIEAAAAAKRAVTILEKLAAEDLSYSYGLACALALQARLDPAAPGPPLTAVAALKKAVEAGFDNLYRLNHDDRFEPIRSRDDFQDVIQLVKNKSVTAGDSGSGPRR